MARKFPDVLKDRIELELRDLKEAPIPDGKTAAADSERRNGRVAALEDVLGWMVDGGLEEAVDERLAKLSRPKRRSAKSGAKVTKRQKRRR